MPRLVKKRSSKAGAAPGTLIHIGERRIEKTRITLIDYDEAHFESRTLETLDELTPPEVEGRIRWINVDGLHELAVLETVGERFGLHALILEDILNTDQRPKLEEGDDYLYLTLKMLEYHERRHEIEIEQLSLIVTSNCVLSFQEREGDVFDPIRERLRHNKGRLRKMGADLLAYSLIDAVVDDYFVILEKVDEHIEALEEELVINPTSSTLQTLHFLKREMILLRKAVWPLREVVSALERGMSPLIQPSTRIYLKDVHDHIIQVIDATETFRDLLASMMDIYLSSISNRMNEIMKVLTTIATLFIPLTFVTGLFGMNFKYIPTLEARWGFPAVLVGMGVMATLMLAHFRKRGWL